MDDLDQLIAPPANPASSMGPAAMGLARYLSPNIMSLISGEAAPPPAPMAQQPGKTPSTDDPRIAGAVGEGVQGGLGALALMAPGGAAAAGGRALEGAAMRAGAEAPNLGALAGAVGGLAGASDPAEAASLTRKQRQELQFQKEQHAQDRERLQLEAQDKRREAEAANAQALELEKQRMTIAAENKRREAEDASRIALEKQKEEQELTRKHEAAMANRPFREKYPEMSNALSNMGVAISALLPYGTRMKQAGKTAGFFKDWEDVAGRAEQALAKGDLPQARILVDQLMGFKKQEKLIAEAAKKGGSNAPLYAASAASPVEFSMVPEQIDLATGSKDAKDKALETFTDPVRIPAGALQGATFAALGAKAPLLGRSPNPSLARTEGATKTFKALTRQRVDQAKKAGRKVTPVEHDPFK